VKEGGFGMGVRPFFWYEVANRSKGAEGVDRRDYETPGRLRRHVDLAVRGRRSLDDARSSVCDTSYVHDCNFLD
jgi:hypothetical protein